MCMPLIPTGMRTLGTRTILRCLSRCPAQRGTSRLREARREPYGMVFSLTSLQGPGQSYTITGLQLAAQVKGTLNNSSDQDIGFISETRIPFADIYQGVPGGHPVDGTQLRLNLNRINWNTPVSQGGPGATGSDTYYAWSPVPGTGVSFHRPGKFGTVTFSTNAVPAPAWAFTQQMLLGNKLVLSGVGHPAGTYLVVVSTNLSSPIASWTRIATNSFDSLTGQFSFTNTLVPDSPQLFYRLQSP